MSVRFLALLLLPLLAACGPHSTWLVFASAGEGNVDLYAMPIGGGEAVRLTSDPEPDEYPSAGPRSGRIVFVRGSRGSRDLWLLDGSAARPLTNEAGDEATPAWSPDEQWIYYTKTADGRSRILRMRADGSGVEGIPSGTHSDAYPSPSSDGRSLVFHSYRDGGSRTALFLSDAAGGQQRRLTEAVGRDYEPSFSPDGRTVVFSSNRGGGPFQIHSVTVATGEIRRLTSFDVDCWVPRFLPSGDRIVFHCGSGRAARLYRMATDGSGLTLLPTGDFPGHGVAIAGKMRR